MGQPITKDTLTITIADILKRLKNIEAKANQSFNLLSGTGLDAIYLRLDASNDPMTGILDMGTNAIIMQASDNSRWLVTIATDGTLTSTEIVATTGSPMGLSLVFTNS